MDNHYQINLPTGMTHVHPYTYSSVVPTLAAIPADRVFVSGTNFNQITCNNKDIRLFDASNYDIFRFNPATNQKKEV
jgi:hypothetical protein